MKNFVFILCAVLIVFGGIVQKVEAVPITFTFEGTVVSVDPVLREIFDRSQVLSGSYTFESTTKDIGPHDPNRGAYRVLDLTYTIGSYTGTLDGSRGGVIPIMAFFNRGYRGYHDFYAMTARTSGPSVAGYNPGSFSFFIRYRDAQFSDDSLPLTPPPLLNVYGNRWNAGFWYRDEKLNILKKARVKGKLTALGLSPDPAHVPAPATMFLLTSGLLALVGFRRMSKRNQ